MKEKVVYSGRANVDCKLERVSIVSLDISRRGGARLTARIEYKNNKIANGISIPSRDFIIGDFQVLELSMCFVRQTGYERAASHY